MKPEYNFSKAKRGAIDSSDDNQTTVKISLDNDIIDWFREAVNKNGGGNYHQLINQALRNFIDSENESLELMLRRVIREELTQK